MKYEFEKGPFDISFDFIVELNILQFSPQISRALLNSISSSLKVNFFKFSFLLSIFGSVYLPFIFPKIV